MSPLLLRGGVHVDKISTASARSVSRIAHLVIPSLSGKPEWVRRAIDGPPPASAWPRRRTERGSDQWLTCCADFVAGAPGSA